jgi:hypothetical protein
VNESFVAVVEIHVTQAEVVLVFGRIAGEEGVS